jgi:hypothetical protein
VGGEGLGLALLACIATTDLVCLQYVISVSAQPVLSKLSVAVRHLCWLSA